MESEIVSLVAFDHYARVTDEKVIYDQATGAFLYKVVFDQENESDITNFEMSKPDDKFAFKKNNWYLGVDSTKSSPDIRSQYYLIEHRFGYESFFVGTVSGSGLLVAFIQYIDAGASKDPYISVPFTVKRKQ